MIQFIEFRMFVNLSDEQILNLQRGIDYNGVKVELLPKPHKSPFQVLKVQIDVPSLFSYGDYDENIDIGNVKRFISKIQHTICDVNNISKDQILLLQRFPYRLVDKITVGQNVFLGNREFYRGDIPLAECIRYHESDKWVYHLGPKADFLTAFHGQGKKLMRLNDSISQTDYTKNIRISEGIFSYRFDLTLEQMTKISPTRQLHELIDEGKLYDLLKEWANKLPKMPVFQSIDEIMKCIKKAQGSDQTKYRLKRFIRLFLEHGYKGCKQYYSPASFSRHYSDLKKLLGVYSAGGA